MSRKAEKLQDAIGLISDGYIEEAHAESPASGHDAANLNEATAKSADTAGKAAEGQSAAKVLQMPSQRRHRKMAGPIAIAACLVIALGVGALAFTSMNGPVADLVEDEKLAETVETSATGSESESGMADIAEGSEAYTTDSDAYNGGPRRPNPTQEPGSAYVLTAGEWNDNDNWSFFTNLVTSNTVSFPVFGLDPVNRVKVNVHDAQGNPVRGEEVELLDAQGRTLWTGVSGKDGCAYLFFRNGDKPDKVMAGNIEQYLPVATYEKRDRQGDASMQHFDDVDITVAATSDSPKGLQVMFIVDTTGSMADEIAYLQKDFASIARDAGGNGIEYSVNFYRDQGDAYVTKCNGFTGDVSEVQALLMAEYADGGGDEPEAVADILAATITDNGTWRDDCNKVAFLIFDAPPHDGTDAALNAAVRSAAERGIRLVPVVASNANRTTELFGRALAIMTAGTYVFLTDDSGVGNSHLEPIVGDYSVELLHDVIVRIIQDNR